jgi:hypothetical protein
MKSKIVFSAVLVGALVFNGNAALACSVAGPNKHVGEVTAVDNTSATFTIMDAETRAPITFQASAAILKNVSSAKGQVMVSYEEKGDDLVAVDVHF